MVLYDIGAILLMTGMILLVRFALSSHKEKNWKLCSARFVLCGLLEATGGVLMIVAHYIIAGNSSFLGF